MHVCTLLFKSLLAETDVVVSPDRGGAGAVLSGVHHPAHMTLHGRIGAVPRLSFARGLKEDRSVIETFSIRSSAELIALDESSYAPWHRAAVLPSPQGRSGASAWGPSAVGCEASGVCGHCGSWASQAL